MLANASNKNFKNQLIIKWVERARVVATLGRTTG
jgi:hypothetical protein